MFKIPAHIFNQASFRSSLLHYFWTHVVHLKFVTNFIIGILVLRKCFSLSMSNHFIDHCHDFCVFMAYFSTNTLLDLSAPHFSVGRRYTIQFEGDGRTNQYPIWKSSSMFMVYFTRHSRVPLDIAAFSSLQLAIF